MSTQTEINVSHCLLIWTCGFEMQRQEVPSAVALRKNQSDIYTIVCTLSPSGSRSCNATLLLSLQPLVYPRYNWSGDLTWFKNQSEHSPQPFFSWPCYFEAGSFPQTTAFTNTSQRSDRNLLLKNHQVCRKTPELEELA